LDVPTAVRLARQGQAVILVRRDTETADIACMVRADGVLTAAGSRTSHAAAVAGNSARSG
jgi:pyruvate, orthophosphate dikinase